MSFIDATNKEKIFSKLKTEIKNTIDAKKYHLGRVMRENLKNKAQDKNVSENDITYKLLYELAEEEVEFLMADVEWYKTRLEKEKSKKWYKKLWESVKNEFSKRD